VPVCGAKAETHEVQRKVVKRTVLENGNERFEEVLEPVKGKDGNVIYAEGKPVKRPMWETITSPRSEMRHDPRKHAVFASRSEDT
jgi:hypothetical protein